MSSPRIRYNRRVRLRCRRPARHDGAALTAKSPCRLYAGGDAISVDIGAARHIGLVNPKASVRLKTACHWFGDPIGTLDVVGPDEPIAGWKGPHRNSWTTLLSLLAYPVYEYASGQGALFVPEMDCDSFLPTLMKAGGSKLAAEASNGF